jgi:hypothetical protein
MVERRPAPTWFRATVIVLLLWGAAGCFACFQQFRLGADAMGPADAYQRAIYASLPVWYNPVYAVAVAAGFLGALALYVRAAHALPLFIVSLLAVIVQFGWLFATTDIIAHRGPGTAGFPLFIVAITASELWLARHAARRGWIG